MTTPATQDSPPPIAKLEQAFTTAAATHFGATGWTVLNAAGDRKYGDFDFWSVRQACGVPRWEVVAQFETRTGRVVRPAEASMTTDAGAGRRPGVWRGPAGTALPRRDSS